MRNVPVARRTLAAAILLLLGAAPASADTVWTRAPDGAVAAEQRVRVLRIDEQYLVYAGTPAGERRARVRDVDRVQVDGEAALDRGEAAYADGRFEAAAAAYEQALRGTRRRAVQSWASVRLVQSGNRAGRLDTAALGFEFLLKHDPAVALYFLPDVGMLWGGLGDAAAAAYAAGMRRLGTLHDELAAKPLTREQERAFAVFENHTAYTLDLFQRPGGGGGAR